jgi:monovalent cation:H+ antiporter, CPA1 family
MEQFLQNETIIIELLLVVSLVAIAVRQLRVPYTVALVLVGLGITFQQPLEINLIPELILALLVPPLVFEAAFHINFGELRRSLPTIFLLAVPGVIITTIIVGGLVAWFTPLSLPVALVFGALISATDPVAIVSLFRSIGIPRRLALLVESESLFNDGTAIVVFNLMLAIALTGKFDLVMGVADFVRVSAGGTIIGLALGWLISRIITRVDDYLIETTLTTVLAFGAYLLAERFHVSGVLAVVAAGLVNGNISPQGMSPTTRIVLFNFWEYVAFLANSLVFLLIGLQVNLPSLMSAWQPILGAILAVLVARVVVVYGLCWITSRFDEPVPFKWQHVLGWGGLRGAISLALVLTLPVAMGTDRELLRLMAFGVVLFTLLVQSTTMGKLVHWLRIVMHTESQVEYEVGHARLTALRAAEGHLERLHREGLVTTHTWEKLKPDLNERSAALANQVHEVLRDNPALEAEEIDTARRELLRSQRSTLQDLRRDGAISEEVFEKLVAEVDVVLDNNEIIQR